HVRAVAVDGCTNTATSAFDVSVSGLNQVWVRARLENPSTTGGVMTRAISFDLDNGACGPICAELGFIRSTGADRGLTATDVDTNYQLVRVPCGPHTCISIKDELHTLRRTLHAADPGHLVIEGTHYRADFDGIAGHAHDLRGGDLQNDDLVDILDFGV